MLGNKAPLTGAVFLHPYSEALRAVTESVACLQCAYTTGVTHFQLHLTPQQHMSFFSVACGAILGRGVPSLHSMSLALIC